MPASDFPAASYKGTDIHPQHSGFLAALVAKFDSLSTTTPITDPGNGLAIPVTSSGICALTTAGAETRTLAIPTVAGQRLVLHCDTYVGDCVITVAAQINPAGNTVITMGNAGDMIDLVAITVGSALQWSVAGNNGCGLT